MIDQQALVDAVFAKMQADAGTGGVYALTSSKVYNGSAAQQAEMPYVRFFLLVPKNVDYFVGTDFDTQFQIDAFGNRRDGSKVVQTIADRINALFHRQSLTVSGGSGVQTTIPKPGRFIWEKDAYRICTICRVFGTSTT